MALPLLASIAIPAISSLIGGRSKRKAEQQALRQQQEAEQAAIARQEPFRQAGLGALERYQTLLGIETPAQQQTQGPLLDPQNTARGDIFSQNDYGLSAKDKVEIRNQFRGDPRFYDVDGSVINQSGLTSATRQAQLEFAKKKQQGLQQQQQTATAPKKPGASDLLDIIKNTPGYQFAQQQGEQAAIRAASATGFGGSGNLAIELTDRASSLAQGTFQDHLSNLQSLIGGGQQAAGLQGNAFQRTGEQQATSSRNRGEIGNELLGDLTKIGGYAFEQFNQDDASATAGSSNGYSLSGGILDLNVLKRKF